jgi:hypothetical protein
MVTPLGYTVAKYLYRVAATLPPLGGAPHPPGVYEQNCGGGGLTVTLQVDVPVWPSLSVTVTVYEKLPLTVGVPEIVPLDDMLKPAGSPVAENVYGPPEPPLAVRVTGVMATP